MLNKNVTIIACAMLLSNVSLFASNNINYIVSIKLVQVQILSNNN